MSVYEERQLLKLLESCSEAVDVDPVARRLRRKLLVRQVCHQYHSCCVCRCNPNQDFIVKNVVFHFHLMPCESVASFMDNSNSDAPLCVLLGEHKVSRCRQYPYIIPLILVILS